MMFKKLAKKLNIENSKRKNIATNPLEVDFENRKSIFLNKLTKNAVNLYERKSDIKKFTQLALSDPENESHNDIMNELFSQGVQDLTDDEKLLRLSDNSRFLKDLGLSD